MVFKAPSLYDAGRACASEANAAKYLAGEACFHACENAILSDGGMGYAKEYHVERYMREAWIPRLAPVRFKSIVPGYGQQGCARYRFGYPIPGETVLPRNASANRLRCVAIRMKRTR